LTRCPENGGQAIRSEGNLSMIENPPKQLKAWREFYLLA
jgi:hypothetical protein